MPEAANERSPGEGLVYVDRRSLVRLKAQGEGLPLRAVRVSNRTSGAHLARFRGRGMEFDEARLYQPGDEIRSIDWRVTARTGRPHTKLYRDERERSVLCWVDYRAPMHFATRGVFKSVAASRAAAMLAWSARGLGDKLGALAFSEHGHREIRPGSSDRAVLSLINLLSEFSRQRPTTSSPTLRRDAFAAALARIRRVTRPGSLLFLISDFRDFEPQAERHLVSLARHNDLVLLYLYDPLEAELPERGRYRISDGLRSLSFDASSRVLHQRHRARHMRHRERLTALCRRYRIHLLECATDGDLEQALRQGMGGGVA